MKKCYSEYEITYEDGSKGNVSIRDATAEYMQKIISYCKTVSERAYIDDNVLNSLLDGGKSYIVDGGSIDKAL